MKLRLLKEDYNYTASDLSKGDVVRLYNGDKVYIIEVNPMLDNKTFFGGYSLSDYEDRRGHYHYYSEIEKILDNVEEDEEDDDYDEDDDYYDESYNRKSLREKYLSEGHEVWDYKGYELDLNDDFDYEDETADIYIDIIDKDGKVISTQKGLRNARKYVDDLIKQNKPTISQTLTALDVNNFGVIKESDGISFIIYPLYHNDILKQISMELLKDAQEFGDYPGAEDHIELIVYLDNRFIDNIYGAIVIYFDEISYVLDFSVPNIFESIEFNNDKSEFKEDSIKLLPNANEIIAKAFIDYLLENKIIRQ